MACSSQWPGWESAFLPQFACKYPRTSGSALLPPSSGSDLFSRRIWSDFLKPEMEKLFVQVDAAGNLASALPFKFHPPRLSSHQQVDAVVRLHLCDSYVIRKFQKVPKIKTGSVMRLKIIFNLKLKVFQKQNEPLSTKRPNSHESSWFQCTQVCVQVWSRARGLMTRWRDSDVTSGSLDVVSGWAETLTAPHPISAAR